MAIDIDGTLGDFHGHFLQFAEAWFGQRFRGPTDDNPGLPLWEFMGVAHDRYRECKLAYRQGGMKRSMPAYAGVSRLTRHIHEAGAEVWLCTTRPYLRLDNIDPDTREWLDRNAVTYSALLFDTMHDKGSKYAELHRQAADRVCAIVDDLPEMIDAARELWPAKDGELTPALILRDQPYNRYRDLSAAPTYARRVWSCTEIWDEVSMAIDCFRREDRTS